MRCFEITSADDLRKHAERWDDLWRRSETALPTARAETIALWLEHFAQRGKFRALVVERAGRYIAAAPLVGQRFKRLVEIGHLASNPWSLCGELLLDPSDADADAALDLLLAAACEAWPLLWLEAVNLESQRWQSFLRAAHRAGLAVDVHRRCNVGLTDIDRDSERYLSGRPGGFRRTVRRRVRVMQNSGKLELRALTDLAPEETTPALRRAFEVEARSWKARGGTAVLQHPDVFAYFARQSQQLAGWGQLALFTLEWDGRPIAFEFGYHAKGVYFTHKIGYDEQFSQHGPGHALKWLQAPWLAERDDWRSIDFMGPLIPAVARWTNRTYTSARLVVAPRRVFSRLLMYGYKNLRPKLRRLRSSVAGAPSSPAAETPTIAT